MTADGIGKNKHVFISYRRMDVKPAAALFEVLQRESIPVWFDLEMLLPGQEWRSEILAMIGDPSVAFLACYSVASASSEEAHYQNEEILAAVEYFHRLPPGRRWLVPIRFDDCILPAWDLGMGRTLASLQQVDLFGPEYESNLDGLLTSLHQALGRASAPPRPVRVAEEDEGDLTVRAFGPDDDRPTALMVKGSVLSFPVFAERTLGAPDWWPRPLASRLRAVRTEDPLPGLIRRGWDPQDPWSDLEARERARRYWRIARWRVQEWLEHPDTMSRQLVMGVPSNGRTVIRYAWDIDPDGVWETGQDEAWFGVPLGRRVYDHPALGKAILVEDDHGQRRAALQGFAAGWRVIPASWERPL
jgi:hypothetical protein